MKYLYIITCLYFLCPLSISAVDIKVNPGDDLQKIINQANAGDTITIDGGIYKEISISDRHFNAGFPLIIRGSNEIPTIKNDQTTTGKGILLNNVSYIIFDSLIVEGGMWGIQGFNIDHVIFQNCEITNQGQEGIQIRNESQYVDIINCHIHNTGLVNAQWGEGIYIGGENGGNTNIWIEGCTIHDCGYGEGINIKANETSIVTMRNNEIYNIKPGCCDQWNSAAIAVDNAKTDKDVSREIWIEDNYIHDIYNGETANSGIMVMGVGVYIVNNIIENCGDEAIWLNAYDDNVNFVYTFNNSINNTGGNFRNGGVQWYKDDPGNNPHTPQLWYGSTNLPVSIMNASLPMAMSNISYEAFVIAYGGEGVYHWSLTEGSLPEEYNLQDSLHHYQINGLTNAHGKYDFTVKVDDGKNEKSRVFELLVANIDTSNIANHLTYLEHSDNLASDHPIEGLWDMNYLGEDQSGWPGSSEIDTFWVIYDLGAIRELSEIRLFGDAGGTWVCKHYSVLAKNTLDEEWNTVIDYQDCFGDQWYDTDVNMSARYVKLMVEGDTTMHRTQAREFEIYTKLNHKYISLDVQPDNTGKVKTEGHALLDSVLTIKAEPNEGYQFDHWIDENNNVISDNPEYSLIITDDINLTASFTKNTGISNPTRPDHSILFVYPSIVSLFEEVNVTCGHAELSGNEYIFIYDITGRLVNQRKYSSLGKKILAGQLFPSSGIYFFQIKDKTTNIIQKIVVK